MPFTVPPVNLSGDLDDNRLLHLIRTRNLDVFRHYFQLPAYNENEGPLYVYNTICKLAQNELDKNLHFSDWREFAKSVDSRLYCQAAVFNARKEGHVDIRY